MLKAGREVWSEFLGYRAVEAESGPGVVSVLVGAAAGQRLDPSDAQTAGVFDLPVEDLQPQSFALQALGVNVETVVDNHQPVVDAANDLNRAIVGSDRVARVQIESVMVGAYVDMGRIGRAGQTGIMPRCELVVEEPLGDPLDRPFFPPVEEDLGPAA